MSEIELACHTNSWGAQGFIAALSDIEAAKFRGIEMTAEVVEQFEDRVAVFREILTEHHLTLIAITAGGSMWPGMNLDEEVERGVNIARFLKNSGANALTLMPPMPNPDNPLEDELDLMPAATAYGEIARRTLELDVKTCLHPEVDSYVDTPKALEKFIQMADPEAMHLCVDIGYLAKAKVNPTSFIKENKRRIGLVHLKDIKAKDLKPRKSATSKPIPGVELGKGSLELQEFVDSLLDVEYTGWGTVEFDPSPSKSLLEIARSCHKYAEQTLDLVF